MTHLFAYASSNQPTLSFNHIHLIGRKETNEHALHSPLLTDAAAASAAASAAANLPNIKLLELGAGDIIDQSILKKKAELAASNKVDNHSVSCDLQQRMRSKVRLLTNLLIRYQSSDTLHPLIPNRDISYRNTFILLLHDPSFLNDFFLF